MNTDTTKTNLDVLTERSLNPDSSINKDVVDILTILHGKSVRYVNHVCRVVQQEAENYSSLNIL